MSQEATKEILDDIKDAYEDFEFYSNRDTNRSNAVRAKKKASELITLLKQYKPI